MGTEPSELGTAVADDVLADGDLDVTSWTDLEGLPDDLDVLTTWRAQNCHAWCESTPSSASTLVRAGCSHAAAP